MSFEKYLYVETKTSYESDFIQAYSDFKKAGLASSSHLLECYFEQETNSNAVGGFCILGNFGYSHHDEGILYFGLGGYYYEMPDDYRDILFNCYMGKNEEDRAEAFEQLYKKLNENCAYGVFFTLRIKNGIHFLYFRPYEVDVTYLRNISAHEFQENYPILFSTIETEIENKAVKELRLVFEKDYFIETVDLIGKVLIKYDLPGIQLIQSLAGMKYENRNNEGSICFAENIESATIHFVKPQPLVNDESRAIRKYFQMTGDSISLLATRYKPSCYFLPNDPKPDVWTIVGIGAGDKHKPILSFSAGKKWTLKIQNEEMGYDGERFFARKQFQKEDTLLDELKFMCSDEEIKTYQYVVNLLKRQEHGTMLVISSIAEREAKRLGNLRRAFEVEDYSLSKLSEREALFLSSIDGSIIADVHGNCKALGAILDGDANIATDIGRGARYNAALTYIKKMRNVDVKAAAIVISEDGTVDAIFSNTVIEKESYFDKIKAIEHYAMEELQDTRFEQRFALLDEDNDDRI